MPVDTFHQQGLNSNKSPSKLQFFHTLPHIFPFHFIETSTILRQF